jgi:DNA-binding NarL/FixJ family response regulator
MVMKSLNPERAEAANDKKEQYKKGENKPGILIIDGHHAVCQGLARLINQETDLGVCVEAESANQALAAIEKQHPDFAIVDISPASKISVQLAERIRLRCPNLPILMLSMHDESFYSKGASQEESKENIINQKEAEQIKGAIHYVQSLLRNQVFGFTILVKVERSG